ncbi:thioesterase II family protein [Streptomyces sp. NPDC088789]|uniref:thioesterase II family protein n=1 Tax=Streptomyces sp. NPDC088789 TaxID=3365899 RepID=UPI00381216FA
MTTYLDTDRWIRRFGPAPEATGPLLTSGRGTTARGTTTHDATAHDATTHNATAPDATRDATGRPGATAPPVRLVCFPHAGGSAGFYRPLAPLLRPRVEVLAVQYPGRLERRDEPQFTEIEPLADAIADVLEPSWTRAPAAFLGHSMGAVVAYETARRLTATTGTGPLALFASGRRAPSTEREGEALHLADDQELTAEIVRQGGTPPELLADPEILAMVLPTLRGDYRAVERYRHRPGPRITAPVTVLFGTEDTKVTPREAHAWERHTDGPTEVLPLPGGHFFLTGQMERIAGVIRSRLPQGDPGPDRPENG